MGIKLSEHFSYKKLLRFVMPTVFMMIVTSVYSIVDGFFVSNFVSKNAFAAVNLVMPVLMLLGINGIWLSVPVAEGVTLILTVTFLITNKKKYNY